MECDGKYIKKFLKKILQCAKKKKKKRKKRKIRLFNEQPEWCTRTNYHLRRYIKITAAL